MKTKKIKVAVIIYEGFDILDVSGPFAMFSSSDLVPILASQDGKPVSCWQGFKLMPTASFKEVDGADVIWVPGGAGDSYWGQFKHGNPLFKWLARQMKTATLLCSVCTGAHIAAASGWLKGYKATTHWLFQKELALFPEVTVVPGFPRYWRDGNRVTGGGISSGLDESLAVIAMLLGPEAAMHAQLINQYAPLPPYNCGTPDIADPKVLGDAYTQMQDGLPQNYATIQNFVNTI